MLMLDINEITRRCEEEFGDDIEILTVKDLGECYGLAITPKGSKYVGGQIILYNKRTGSLDLVRRNREYNRAEVLWEKT